MWPAAARAALGIALAILGALGASACAPTPTFLSPPPPAVRNAIHRLAILGPPPPRFVYEKPRAGAGWGYLRGTGACFDGVLSAGGDGAAVGLALGLVACPTIGGAVGAVRTPTEAEVAEARAALERVAGAAALGDALPATLATLLARAAPQYTVAAPTSDATARPPSVDTAVVLDWLHVTLLRCGGGTPIVPPLTLYAAVDARLVRADTGAVLHHARIEHWGETFPFVGWGAGGAARFARGLDRAQNSLAEQLVQSFFVAQTPTALPRLPCGRPAGTGPPPP